MRNWFYDTKLTPDSPIKAGAVVPGKEHLRQLNLPGTPIYTPVLGLLHKRQAYLVYESDLGAKINHLKRKHQKEVEDLEQQLTAVWDIIREDRVTV